MPTALREKIISWAHSASLEISTFKNPADLADVKSRRLFIPSSPAKDPVETTIAYAVQLKNDGFNPVPHIAVRNYKNRAHLEEALSILQQANITRILLIAGDKQNPGAITNTLEILEDNLLVKYGMQHVCFAGHPNGHPHASPQEADLALKTKNAFVQQTKQIEGSLITQLCFNAGQVLTWANRINGNTMPIIAGIYGPLQNPPHLIRAARLCGYRWAEVLAIAPHIASAYVTGAVPTQLILDYAQAPTGKIAGLHIFTFGNVAGTAKMLRALEEGQFEITRNILGKRRLALLHAG
ncbi:MAG: methylenetetrahydrofolate reductase [Alphaproteobacteria bacterium]